VTDRTCGRVLHTVREGDLGPFWRRKTVIAIIFHALYGEQVWGWLLVVHAAEVRRCALTCVVPVDSVEAVALTIPCCGAHRVSLIHRNGKPGLAVQWLKIEDAPDDRLGLNGGGIGGDAVWAYLAIIGLGRDVVAGLITSLSDRRRRAGR